MHNLHSERLNIGDKVMTHGGSIDKGIVDINSHGIDKGDNSGVVKCQPCNLKKNTDSVLVNKLLHCVNTSKRNTPY